MDGKFFQAWLQHFQAIVNSSIDKKAMLILDNHSIHLYLSALNFAHKHGIKILSIPSPTSKLQPVDITFFGPLKTYISQEIDNWMVNNPEKHVTKYNMAQLLNAAYEKAKTLRNALSGFRSSGIMPFNPDVFSKSDFEPALFKNINAEETSSMNMPLNQKASANLEKNTEIAETVTSNASANNIITPVAVFQVTSTSHTPNESPSTSTHLNTLISNMNNLIWK